MKTKFKILSLYLCLGAFLLFTYSTAHGQERLMPPKKLSKVKSIDGFSDHTFKIYNSVFVYDSLTNAGVEIPAEIEDEIAADIETRIDSISNIVPDMIEEVDDAPIMRKLRATLSLNKSRKAITYMLVTMKKYTLGESEEETEVVKN